VLGGESNLEYRVRALLENPNPTAAIYCKTGECEIRITARAQNDAEAQTMCRAYAKKFYDLLGDAVYDEDVAGLEETVVHTLQANGLTIATAESCTGGMIAQRLTSVSGASEVFGYGFVTYWEQAKAKLVGVDPAVIAQYNVVSAPVAAQMALGACIVTFFEFWTGVLVNRVMHLGVWDYSAAPFNLLGQICLPFTLLWFPLCGIGILLDRGMRRALFGTPAPQLRWV